MTLGLAAGSSKKERRVWIRADLVLESGQSHQRKSYLVRTLESKITLKTIRTRLWTSETFWQKEWLFLAWLVTLEHPRLKNEIWRRRVPIELAPNQTVVQDLR